MKAEEIKNVDEVKSFFIDFNNILNKTADIKKELELQIDNTNLEQEDYLHELELAKLNGIEIMHVAKLLISVRKRRRELKDSLEIVNTVKGFTDVLIKKGVVSETKVAIKNIDNLVKNQAERVYNPKIVKNLKCGNKNSK